MSNEMNELFYKDTYCKEFDAVVLSCVKGKKDYEVVLSDTAFYPEGGGQPADGGTIDQIVVKDVRRVDGTIIHHLENPVEIGKTVHGVIDWARRFDHMQQHTGEHIVSGLIHRNYGYENIGFHLGVDTITIDFDGPLDWEKLKEIENQANQVIWNNEKILIDYPDEETLKTMPFRSKKELHGTVRIVTIPQADVCACCGTHVACTGEVGLIKFLSIINRKDGVRIEMVSGKRALQYMQRVYDENSKISHLLSAKPLETSLAVERLQKEKDTNAYALREMVQNQMQAKLEGISGFTKLYIDVEEFVDAAASRKFCNAVLENGKADTCVVLMKKETEYVYLIMTKALPMRTYIKELNTLLHGRGGGSDEMVQGSFQAALAEIENVLKEKLG